VEEGGRRYLGDGRGTMRLLDLAEILGLARSERGTVLSNVIGGVPLAVVVEGVVGQEEVFLRPMPPRAGAPAVFDGIALLGSGRPVPVLSPQRLLAHETISDSGPGGQPLPEPVRVLVVDDSPTTRDLLGRTLTEAGFAVTAVASAEAALGLLVAEPFDCLVTDIEMPGIGGLELTRTVRTDERWSELPVVVVSTRDLPEDRRAGLEAGADAYLAKQGLEAGELVAVVRDLGGS
jgi:two-component system chemotaxis sensor kinase CheA